MKAMKIENMSTIKMGGSKDEDHVVKEVDLFLAKGLAEKLFLFQYPVRPSSMTYDNTPHLAARMKPKQQKVELELGMDISSSTYYFARGEQIAHAVDRGGQGNNQKPLFPSLIMDRQTLSSVRATETNHKYAAAIYNNGAIHITPVKGIVQLRPGFSYFDKAEENNKKAAEALLAAEQDQSQSDDEVANAKPVQLRFAKVQANIKKETREDTRAKEHLDENWIEMEFFQPNDRRSKMEQNLLYCHQTDFESPEFTATSRDYLKILAPTEKPDDSAPAALPHGVLSLLKLKDMELADQIKALLITAKVIQFTQLCTLLGGGLEDVVVLKGLIQYAVLVQGCWVVKSDVLYPKGSSSPVSGIAAEKLWPTRDYLLFCFNRKRVLSRKEVNSTGRIPTEEMREVLEQVARQRPAQGWEFMLNTDTDFLHRYQETCSGQATLWVNRYKSLVSQLSISDDFPVSGWKETDLPGIFAHLSRKPATPRQKRNVSQDSNSDSKQKASTRKGSQSESGENVSIKEEKESPVRDKSSKMQVSPVEKHERKTKEKPGKRSKAIKNISKEYLSDSDSSSKEDAGPPTRRIKTTEKLPRSPAVILQVDEKPGNEVEVEEKHGGGVDDIFIPPVAAGLKTTVKKERPPSEIFLKELKRFCTETIRSSCVSLHDLKELLSVRQQESGNILCTGVTDQQLVSCVLETGATEIQLKVPVGTNIPEEHTRIFIYEKLGEHTDKFRSIVINLFRNSLSLRRKEIFEAFSKSLGTSPSNHAYSKMMVEFCDNHNGQWYLNGSFQSIQKHS